LAFMHCVCDKEKRAELQWHVVLLVCVIIKMECVKDGNVVCCL